MLRLRRAAPVILNTSLLVAIEYSALGRAMELGMLGIVLTVVLVVAFLAVLPQWSHSRQWGYYPTGGIGAVLLVVIVLLALGRI